MDSPCIKQTVCKVLKIFQYGKYLVAYVLKSYNGGLWKWAQKGNDNAADAQAGFRHCYSYGTKMFSLDVAHSMLHLGKSGLILENKI